MQQGARFKKTLRWFEVIGWTFILAMLIIISIFVLQVKLLVLLFKHWR